MQCYKNDLHLPRFNNKFSHSLRRRPGDWVTGGANVEIAMLGVVSPHNGNHETMFAAIKQHLHCLSVSDVRISDFGYGYPNPYPNFGYPNFGYPNPYPNFSKSRISDTPY